jgi:hypothetical protein
MTLTMKNYLLLRDNVQSGPFALEDLERLTLRPLDLLWIERESTRWYSVSELPELQKFVVAPPRRRGAVAYTPRTVTHRPRYSERKSPVTAPMEAAAPPAVRALPEFHDNPRQPRKFSFRPAHRHNSPVWIVGLFVCLVAGAVVVEKIMESPQPESITPIKMAAQPLPMPEEKSLAKPADIDYQNAIKKETITPDSSAKPISRAGLRTLRRQVTIQTNEERVGIFGGINDLQVCVRNGSEQLLQKVNLIVEFFRPNGKSISREQYSVYGVQPHSQKILVVPATRRGMKVRYKLLGVETTEPAPEQTTA